MKKIIFILLSLCFLYSCSNTGKSVQKSSKSISTNKPGNDGSSFENAIVIEESSESAGVAAEYAWLSKNYPGYVTQSQALIKQNGKTYDKINISTVAGDLSIYFDISNFYGKF